MAPNTIKTDDFLALSIAPVKVELLIQVYDRTARKWKTATDAALIAEATTAAAPEMRPGLTMGHRLFIGDLLGQRVNVEVK